MSNSEEETETGIADEQLPDDLVPSEDNPLAEGLEDGESAGDLLEEGKHAEGDERDQDDTEDSDESED
ncbi:MAG TPA: hypothetical protein VFO49_18040 [Nocardioides sp.]|nr:hypothetical protein [Nocardioides sp.]